MLLYNLIVRPLEILFEIIFVLMTRFFGKPAPALIALSIAVSFLVLPLYLKADKIQEEEQKKKTEMEKWVSHIRKSFHGDERYMMQSVYYREQGYRPIYTIRGTISLLLQIPFFMAAYHYLSHATILSGSSFGIIEDLSKPDSMISVNGIAIHILPILMTVINCISGTIYTKGLALRQKMQVYGLAAVFLILLYNSPSGLVIYWTMNNLFSLGKNIVMKYIRNKRLFLSVLLFIMGSAFVVYSVVGGNIQQAMTLHDYEYIIGILLITLLFWMPLLLCFVPESIRAKVPGKKREVQGSLTVMTTVSIILFEGILVPLSVVSSSPLEFVNIYQYQNPLRLVLVSALIFGGLFGIWGNLVIFPMLTSDAKYRYTQVLFCILLSMFINFFFFQADMGTCEIELNFVSVPRFSKFIRYGNAILILVLVILGGLLFQKKQQICKYMILVSMAAILVQSGQMILKVDRELKGIKVYKDIEEEKAVFPFSKDQKNVVVIMLDRAMAGYVPFIMEEKPELLDQFDGFVFYPNAVSSGMWTGVGAPAIFGGYEYLAESLNKRKDETMAEKHNQALKLMPYLFKEEGYNITVSDLPYVGYKEIADYSIYDDIGVDHFFYEDRFSADGSWDDMVLKVERNLFMYSIMRTAPALLQDNIYDQSCYLTGDGVTTDQSVEYGQAYRALEELSDYTEIREEDHGELILYANYLTHEPAYMQLPDYTYAEHVHNEEYDFQMIRELDGITMDLNRGDYYPTEHYFANAAALLRLGEWFDMLREEGVYDNTRIILVADHGRGLHQFDHMMLENGMDVQAVNILLMVKDFNSTGFVVDDSFMTNADVPLIAMDGIVSDPINPYTGEELTAEEKEDGIDVFTAADMGMFPGNTILPKGTEVYHVKDDIFQKENWSITTAR